PGSGPRRRGRVRAVVRTRARRATWPAGRGRRAASSARSARREATASWGYLASSEFGSGFDAERGVGGAFGEGEPPACHGVGDGRGAVRPETEVRGAHAVRVHLGVLHVQAAGDLVVGDHLVVVGD